MGGAPSRAQEATNDKILQRSPNEVVRLMMPVYYTLEPISSQEHASAAETWQLILSNKAPNYIAQRKLKDDFFDKYPTSMRYFSDCFYCRLFDVHPSSRNLFKDVVKQGKFLVGMISVSLSELSEPLKFEETLVRLAEVHNVRGIKAAECKSQLFLFYSNEVNHLVELPFVDGIVGEVLFWSLRRCLGAQTFNDYVHGAWVKVYSRMLRTMVPVVVSYELQNRQESINQLNNRRFHASAVVDQMNINFARSADECEENIAQLERLHSEREKCGGQSGRQVEQQVLPEEVYSEKSQQVIPAGRTRTHSDVTIPTRYDCS